MGISVLASLGENVAALPKHIWVYPLSKKDKGARGTWGGAPRPSFPVLLSGESFFFF